ncbi:F-box domain [Cinara cedri]|uniref:F-box domain n=1 Tax=Cinara cedri TaxID=506608 RepID=A0A5E4NL38_9HEMI|nr:F-box domain [Cinara cedri]
MAGVKENALKRVKCDDAGNKHKLIRTAATAAFVFDENVSANFDQSSSVVSRQSASSSTDSLPAAKFNFFDFSFGPSTAAPRRPKLDLSVVKRKKNTHDDYAYSKRVGLEGRKYLDFMHYLGERYNFIVVVEKILSFLDGEDLTSMSQVSDTWRDVIKRSLPAKQKQASYRSWARSEKENRKNSEQSLRRAAPVNRMRKVLNDVTNVDLFPPSSDKKKHTPLKFGVLDFLLS